MKVAFIVRSTFYSTFGGDTAQTLATAEFLKKEGVDVDICFTHLPVDYNKYDLLHFFNIIRPDDILPHIKRTNKKFVVSSIFVDYSYYATQGNHWLYPMLYKLLSADQMEYLKRIARSLLNAEPFPSFTYLIKGHQHAIHEILLQAQMLLPNSESEYQRLKKHYPVANKYHVVPNGIDTSKFKPIYSLHRDPLKVICVGRIEVRKNQLNLIRALNRTPFQLHIIGKPAPNHLNYLDKCRQEAASNIYFHDHVDDNDLLKHYSTANVHILPSRFETTGLSTLEAIGMGCKAVITDCGDTRDYFGDYLTYCNPEDPDSILRAVEIAAEKKSDDAIAERIHTRYNWKQAASETLHAYKEALA